jgi:hypothetical protein
VKVSRARYDVLQNGDGGAKLLALIAQLIPDTGQFLGEQLFVVVLTHRVGGSQPLEMRASC